MITSTFQAWFGDSKVVDNQGNPLVVYHGTTKPWFSDFSERKRELSEGSDYHWLGFFFTPSLTLAQDYAESKQFIDLYNWGVEGGAVYPCYLKIEKPFLIDWDGDDFVVKKRYYDRNTKKRINGNMHAFIRHAKQYPQKYDGVIVTNVKDCLNLEDADCPVADVYVVFNSTQIKSVDNRGLWHPDDPDIRYNPGLGHGVETFGYLYPGMKGSVLDDGRLVSWRTNRAGYPHHHSMREDGAAIADILIPEDGDVLMVTIPAGAADQLPVIMKFLLSRVTLRDRNAHVLIDVIPDRSQSLYQHLHFTLPEARREFRTAVAVVASNPGWSDLWQDFMMSHQGELIDLDGLSHPNWCHLNYEKYGIDFQPLEGEYRDADGNIALDMFKRQGWIRVRGCNGIELDYIDDIDRVKRLLSAMNTACGRTRNLYVDVGFSINVPVRPTGRLDFTALDRYYKKQQQRQR